MLNTTPLFRRHYAIEEEDVVVVYAVAFYTAPLPMLA